MKLKEPLSVFSNLILLIPLYFGILKNSYLQVIFIALVFTFSIIFHFIKPIGSIRRKDIKNLTNSQKLFLWGDVISAICLIIISLIMFYKEPSVKFYYALLISVIAFFLYFSPKKKNYDFLHSIWHILSGIVILFAI